MHRFFPKEIPVASWRPMTVLRDYAVRALADETIHFRFGQSHGVFILIAPSLAGDRFIHSIDFETGDPVVLGKLPEKTLVTIGRSSECDIKIMHAIVSRQHLSLYLDNNVLLVKDNGSTNGTYCLKENLFFDVEEYLQSHPLDKPEESTLDLIREQFGPTLIDFLKNYSQKRMNQNDLNNSSDK